MVECRSRETLRYSTMKANANTIADFYHQLALLVQSNFPLPDSLRRLVEAMPGTDVRRVLEEIRGRVGNGEKLSEVLATYPQYFDEFHVRLISVGESTDSLSEILYAVARESRFEQFLVSKAREIMTYPLFVLNMAVLLFLGISVFLMPVFQGAYADMAAGGGTVPVFIAACLKVSAVAGHSWRVLVGLLVLCWGLTAWLYSGTVRSHRAMVRLLDLLPGAAGVGRVLDSARICSLLRIFLERRQPMPEALRAAALVVQRPATAAALRRVADRAAQGGALADLMAGETDIHSLISDTLKFRPEDRLAGSVKELQGHYEEEVLVMTRNAAAAWSIIGILMMTAAALLMAVLVFAPVASVHRAVSGL